jgi:hypothetical protein
MFVLLNISTITPNNAKAMAKEITTEILINASTEKVWGVLTNFHNYPSWNPFIKFIEGDVNVGNRVIIRIEPPNSMGMTFKPTVLAFKPNEELRWVGHFLFPGLFDGEHQFKLINNGNGTTTFKQSEKFKGVLLWLLNEENTKKGFISMNSKIKELAEQK